MKNLLIMALSLSVLSARAQSQDSESLEMKQARAYVTSYARIVAATQAKLDKAMNTGDQKSIDQLTKSLRDAKSSLVQWQVQLGDVAIPLAKVKIEPQEDNTVESQEMVQARTYVRAYGRQVKVIQANLDKAKTAGDLKSVAALEKSLSTAQSGLVTWQAKLGQHYSVKGLQELAQDRDEKKAQDKGNMYYSTLNARQKERFMKLASRGMNFNVFLANLKLELARRGETGLITQINQGDWYYSKRILDEYDFDDNFGTATIEGFDKLAPDGKWGTAYKNYSAKLTPNSQVFFDAKNDLKKQYEIRQYLARHRDELSPEGDVVPKGAHTVAGR